MIETTFEPSGGQPEFCGVEINACPLPDGISHGRALRPGNSLLQESGAEIMKPKHGQVLKIVK
jgi:hypothetical protein